MAGRLSQIDRIKGIVVDENYGSSLQANPVNPNSMIIHQDSYEPDYDDVAYIVLCEPGKSLVDVAGAFGKTTDCIRRWVSRHPTFKESIILGFEEGKRRFIEEVYNHAWQPSIHVNNKLIMLIAKNIYGIDTDTEIVVIPKGEDRVSLAEGETSRMYKDALEAIDNGADGADNKQDPIDVEWSEIDE